MKLRTHRTFFPSGLVEQPRRSRTSVRTLLALPPRHATPPKSLPPPLTSTSTRALNEMSQANKNTKSAVAGKGGGSGRKNRTGKDRGGGRTVTLTQSGDEKDLVDAAAIAATAAVAATAAIAATAAADAAGGGTTTGAADAVQRRSSRLSARGGTPGANASEEEGNLSGDNGADSDEEKKAAQGRNVAGSQDDSDDDQANVGRAKINLTIINDNPSDDDVSMQDAAADGGAKDSAGKSSDAKDDAADAAASADDAEPDEPALSDGENKDQGRQASNTGYTDSSSDVGQVTRQPSQSPESARIQQELEDATISYTDAVGESAHFKHKRTKPTLEAERVAEIQKRKENAATAAEVKERLKATQKSLTEQQKKAAIDKQKILDQEKELADLKKALAKSTHTSIPVRDRNPGGDTVDAGGATSGAAAGTGARGVKFTDSTKEGTPNTLGSVALANKENRDQGERKNDQGERKNDEGGRVQERILPPLMGPIEAALRRHQHPYGDKGTILGVPPKIEWTKPETPWDTVINYWRYALTLEAWREWRANVFHYVEYWKESAAGSLEFVRYLDVHMPAKAQLRFVTYIDNRIHQKTKDYSPKITQSAMLMFLMWDFEERTVLTNTLRKNLKDALPIYNAKKNSGKLTKIQLENTPENFLLTRYQVFRQYEKENRDPNTVHSFDLAGAYMWRVLPSLATPAEGWAEHWRSTQSDLLRGLAQVHQQHYDDKKAMPYPKPWGTFDCPSTQPYNIGLVPWNPIDHNGVQSPPPPNPKHGAAAATAGAGSAHAEKAGAAAAAAATAAAANEHPRIPAQRVISISSQDSDVATTLKVLLAAAGQNASKSEQWDNWIKAIRDINQHDPVVIAYDRDPKEYRRIARQALKRARVMEQTAMKNPRRKAQLDRKLFHVDDSADVYEYNPETPERLAQRARLEEIEGPLTSERAAEICAPTPPPPEEKDYLGRYRNWYTVLVPPKKGEDPQFDIIGDAKTTIDGKTVWIKPLGKIQRRVGERDPNLWLGHRISDLEKARPTQRELENDALDRICGEDDANFDSDSGDRSSQSSANRSEDDDSDEDWNNDDADPSGAFLHTAVPYTRPAASEGGGRPRFTHLQYSREKKKGGKHHHKHRSSAARISEAAAATSTGGGGRGPPDGNSSDSSHHTDSSDSEEGDADRRRRKRRERKEKKKSKKKGDGGRKKFDRDPLAGFPGHGDRQHKRGRSSDPSSSGSSSSSDGDGGGHRRLAKIAKHFKGANNHVTLNIHGGGSKDQHKRVSKKDFTIFDPQIDRAEDHVKRLGQEMYLAGVPESKWVNTLIITLPDIGDTRDQLVTIRRLPGETREEHYGRVCKKFFALYRQTDAQVSANKTRLGNIVKHPDESFMFQFKPRFERAYRVTHPAHSGVDRHVAKYLESEKRRILVEAL